jgi:hypothetical protein
MQRLRGVPLLLQQLQVLELWGLNQQQQTQVGCNMKGAVGTLWYFACIGCAACFRVLFSVSSRFQRGSKSLGTQKQHCSSCRWWSCGGSTNSSKHR